MDQSDDAASANLSLSQWKALLARTYINARNNDLLLRFT